MALFITHQPHRGQNESLLHPTAASLEFSKRNFTKKSKAQNNPVDLGDHLTQ